jgi:hypothetical protein
MRAISEAAAALLIEKAADAVPLADVAAALRLLDDWLCLGRLGVDCRGCEGKRSGDCQNAEQAHFVHDESPR